jgi:hypothetical protein
MQWTFCWLIYNAVSIWHCRVKWQDGWWKTNWKYLQEAIVSQWRSDLGLAPGTSQNKVNPQALWESLGTGIEKYYCQIPALPLHYLIPVYNT